MSNEEWLSRYKLRILARTKLKPDFVNRWFDGKPIDTLREGFEDEPEDAADEEMSYWTD